MGRRGKEAGVRVLGILGGAPGSGDGQHLGRGKGTADAATEDGGDGLDGSADVVGQGASVFAAVEDGIGRGRVGGTEWRSQPWMELDDGEPGIVAGLWAGDCGVDGGGLVVVGCWWLVVVVFGDWRRRAANANRWSLAFRALQKSPRWRRAGAWTTTHPPSSACPGCRAGMPTPGLDGLAPSRNCLPVPADLSLDFTPSPVSTVTYHSSLPRQLTPTRRGKKALENTKYKLKIRPPTVVVLKRICPTLARDDGDRHGYCVPAWHVAGKQSPIPGSAFIIAASQHDGH